MSFGNFNIEDIKKAITEPPIVAEPSASGDTNTTPALQPKDECVKATIPDKAPLEEASEIEVLQALSPQHNYTPLSFEDPVELLYFVDDNIASGRLKLHDWQVWTLMFLARPDYTQEERLKFLLTAANGSGKDAYILAAFAVWQLVCKVRSRFIGTSKSANQLNTQTNPYIKNLCVRLGQKLKEQGFHEKPCIYRTKPFQIICQFTGAEILTFVTDEAENVEGYHPPQDYPMGDLTIAINEAKGVPDEYFEGFSRCTYNRWIEVTSPGRMVGKNWDHYNDSVKYPGRYEKGRFYSRKITSYDCPHKSQKVIEEDAIDYGGKDSELFRSKHLAEYTSIGELVVITLEVIDKWLGIGMPKADGLVNMRGGLDLSLGGDETVLVVRRGNTCLSIDAFRIRDATILESNLDKLFAQRGLTKKDPIFTDVGGLGKPIADTLTKLGWAIVPIVNHSAPLGFDKNLYQNRGTEIYYEVCNYYSRGYIRMEVKDALWREQLGSRKYIRMDSDKIKLQPKKELIADEDRKTLSNAKAWNSPDRADAWVLAFTDFEPLEIKQAREAESHGKDLRRITQQQLIERMARDRFGGFKDGPPLKRASFSQSEIMKQMIKDYQGH